MNGVHACFVYRHIQMDGIRAKDYEVCSEQDIPATKDLQLGKIASPPNLSRARNEI